MLNVFEEKSEQFVVVAMFVFMIRIFLNGASLLLGWQQHSQEFLINIALRIIMIV